MCCTFFLVTWGKSNKSDTYTDWNKVRDSVLIVCHHSTKYPTLKTAFRCVSGENTDAEKVTRALPVVQGQQCGTDGARCDSPRGQRTKTATFFIFLFLNQQHEIISKAVSLQFQFKQSSSVFFPRSLKCLKILLTNSPTAIQRVTHY